jgi:hypothetical protein
MLYVNQGKYVQSEPLLARALTVFEASWVKIILTLKQLVRVIFLSTKQWDMMEKQRSEGVSSCFIRFQSSWLSQLEVYM